MHTCDKLMIAITCIYTLQTHAIALPAGCVPVEHAQGVYCALRKAQDCLRLSTELHLLHLVVPHELAHAIQPNWFVFFQNVRVCVHTYEVH